MKDPEDYTAKGVDSANEPQILKALVVTSCTGDKAVERPDQLTLEDFRDPSRLQQREAALSDAMLPAVAMYTGLQHIRLMEGAGIWRNEFGFDALEIDIVSAGYGLVREDQLIAPYEVTFNTMSKSEIISWARRQRIPENVRRRIQGFPLVFFLLGDKYLQAIAPPILPEPKQRVLFFARPGLAPSLAAPGVTVVPAGLEQAPTYGEGLVALKGKMFLLLAKALAREGRRAFDAVIKDDSPKSVLDAIGAAPA